MTACLKDSRRILLFVTGSVAAFKAAALSSKLAQEGFEVRVALSAGAKEFIGASTFAGLTGNRVYESTFAEGDAMAHIDLARWADLALVYPASANTLSKFAHGMASDLVGTLFLAMNLDSANTAVRKNTVWIAPAMNPTMLAHPATQESLAKLASWGCRIVESAGGRLACGEVGVGRLPEPEAMLAEIRDYFSSARTTGEADADVEADPGAQQSLPLGASAGNSAPANAPLAGRKIVLTAGGTSEPIDPVRVLTNTSTGETGVRLANRFSGAGAEVTLLLAETSPFLREVDASVQTVGFSSFADLDRKVSENLARPVDAFVHAAAVSDYSVERIENGEGNVLAKTQKIHSGENLRLVLRPNPKILDRVRAYAKNPELRLISFKLSTAENCDEVDLSGYASDCIVHNAVSGIERGTERHHGEVFAREDQSTKGEVRSKYRSVARFDTKEELGDALVSILAEEWKV
jgi:phosphopantothenoylcysteine decarboxylase/phosphopantothenate--cysteine ligase